VEHYVQALIQQLDEDEELNDEAVESLLIARPYTASRITDILESQGRDEEWEPAYQEDIIADLDPADLGDDSSGGALFDRPGNDGNGDALFAEEEDDQDSDEDFELDEQEDADDLKDGVDDESGRGSPLRGTRPGPRR
jgi:hypothetical protein